MRKTSRVSNATNTLVPRCLAIATHRTRVSEMRQQPSRRMPTPPSAVRVRLETKSFERGDPGTPLH